MAYRLTIEVKGLEAAAALLNPSIYQLAWRRGMQDFGSILGLTAQQRAPKRTGYLQMRIRTAVQPAVFPTWIAIRNYARAKGSMKAMRTGTLLGAAGGGYPYPRLLEFSPKHHHQFWLRNSVDAIWRTRAEPVLEQIGAAIAQKWRA